MRGMRQGRTAGRKWGILILIVMLAVLLAVPPAGIVHAAKKPKKSKIIYNVGKDKTGKADITDKADKN